MAGVSVVLRASSNMRERIQHSSAVVEARDLYSASVEDRATPVCFLDDQAMGCRTEYTI